MPDGKATRRDRVDDILNDIYEYVQPRRGDAAADLLAYANAVSLSRIATALEDLVSYGIEVTTRDGVTVNVPDRISVRIGDTLTLDTR